MNPPVPPKLQTKTFCRVLDSRSKDLDPTRWAYKLMGGGYGLDLTAGEVDVDEAKMALRFPFADGTNRDGVGDILHVEGIDLSRHRLNPLVAWDHFKNITLPIGKAEDPETRAYTVEIDSIGKTAWATSYMYQGKGLASIDPEKEYDHAVFVSQLFDMLTKRFLRGFSIGYQVQQADQLPADYRTGTPQGLDLQNILMLECSVTSLPANPLTVRKAFKNDDDFGAWQEDITSLVCVGNCCGKTLSPVLTKSLSPYVLQRKAQMTVPGHDHKDCHCGGTCGKCKEGKSMEVKSVPATIKEGTRIIYDGEEGTVVYTNELDRKAGFVKVQIDGESSPRNMNQSSLQVKSLPNREQLTTNQTAVPYTPPPKTGPERQMQAELGDAMTSNPQNLLISDGSNPGPATGSISWAKVKQLRKNIRMKRGNKTITGIKSQPSDKIDPKKAEQILKDGTANGKPLTDKQRRLFYAASEKSIIGYCQGTPVWKIEK